MKCTSRMLCRGMLLIITSTLLTLVCSAQPETSPDVDIRADVIYGHKAGMALTYDVLTPQEMNGATVLFMISGGWFSRWRPAEQFVGWVDFLLDEGFTVIAVRHGSAPWFKVPEAVADVRRAVRHVRFHAEDYGIDPNRIGVMGGSAGGHLSLMLGLASDAGNPESEDPIAQTTNEIAAVVAYFPPTDLRGLAGPDDRFPALDFPAEQEADISPINFVSEDDPPVLLIHGDQDRLVPISNSHNLKTAMDKLALNVELLTIEGAAHGFRGDDQIRVREATKDFFLENLTN